MHRFILLLRGINVGGRNLVTMAQLKYVLCQAGFSEVKSYIQSGNLVLVSDTNDRQYIAEQISECINDSFDVNPELLLLTPAELAQILEQSPFKQEDVKAQHFYFLQQQPQHPDLEALEQLKTTSERFALSDQTFYLLAPDGIGRSKLAAAAEAKLGVVTTARNRNTVDKLLALSEL